MHTECNVTQVTIRKLHTKHDINLEEHGRQIVMRVAMLYDTSVHLNACKCTPLLTFSIVCHASDHHRRRSSARGKMNGYRPNQDMRMEGRSRRGRTAPKGGMRKHCVASSCEVSVFSRERHISRVGSARSVQMARAEALFSSLAASTCGTGGSLAEVPSMYEHTDKAFRKQASQFLTDGVAPKSASESTVMGCVALRAYNGRHGRTSCL